MSRLSLTLCLAPFCLTACMVGPDYKRPPAASVTAAFKEAPPGWTVAQPADAAPKGVWWTIYNDPVLNDLESKVAINNQNVLQYEALYRQATATIDIARSALFPTVNATAGVTRSSRGSSSLSSGITTTGVGTTSSTVATGTTGTAVTTGSGNSANTIYQIEGAIDWDLDVWGRIRRQVESDVAAAQVSAADLANATLSAQATLATDYFGLRYQDALVDLLNQTVKAYADALRITQNQFNAGTADSSAYSQALTQLESARALLVNAGVLRAQYEHAIAVLAGLSPAELTIPPGPLAANVPLPPGVIPAVLLQRRPDIAAAERTMQQENALIGVQIAAYYPDISLSAVYGYAGDPLNSLIKAANRIWSLGATATQTLFEGGLRNAEIRAARATYDASVASYRQTVLTAFQNVEDQLSNLRILAQQAVAEERAVDAAKHSVQVALNTYLAGTAIYTNVVTQQTALLTNQETALAVAEARLIASVTLVTALGGGFDQADLPNKDKLQEGLPFLK